MKKFILPVVAASLIMMSCGGSKDDVKVENVCDCMKLRDKYKSKDDALKDLGEEKFKEIDEKCSEFVKNATDEEREKCK